MQSYTKVEVNIEYVLQDINGGEIEPENLYQILGDLYTSEVKLEIVRRLFRSEVRESHTFAVNIIQQLGGMDEEDFWPLVAQVAKVVAACEEEIATNSDYRW